MLIQTLLKPAMMSIIVLASGPSLPRVDIHRTCVSAAGGDGVEKCVADETYARDKLRKHWKQIPSSFKTQCLFDPPPPDPSYIVLRDCINNNEILRQIHKRPGSSQAQ